MSVEDAEFEFRVDERDGYVFVWQRGCAKSAQELEAMQHAITRALANAGSRFAMFDNRETESPDEWVRASMWAWLCNHVDRAAMLQSEARNIKRAVRTANRNRLTVGAFHDEAEAEAWLLAVR